MLNTINSKSVARIGLAAVLAISVAGCSVPKLGLPKVPFISKKDDDGAQQPKKESWSERQKRRKEERLAARRGESTVQSEDMGRGDFVTPDDRYADDRYADDRDPYGDLRRGGSAPSTISPYSEGVAVERDRPDPRTNRLENRDSQLLGAEQRQQNADPLSAEEIGQMATVAKNARRKTRSLNELQPLLRANDRIYTPRGQAPYPTVLFFHGCSGPTLSHERDWANFYTNQGYAMIAVDSITGREVPWEDVCSMLNLNPAERAADVFATLRYVRSLPFVDDERLVLTGFSHGAATIWASLLLASGETPPIGIRDFPREGLQGVKTAYMFYGPCLAPWTVNVSAVTFVGENDRFIDARDCARSARKANVEGVDFDYEIYPGATHTFDHRQPNQANKDAGSVFDRKATDAAQARIKEHLARHMGG